MYGPALRVYANPSQHSLKVTDCGCQYLRIARGMSIGLHSALNKSGIHAGGSSIWGAQQGLFPRFLIVSSLPCVA